MKTIALALGLLVACITPAAAWNATYTLVVPVKATHLSLTYNGTTIAWRVQCWLYSGPNISGNTLATYSTNISPDAGGNFSGNVSVVFPPGGTTSPAGQSYECQLLPQNGGPINGWYGYTPPPPYNGSFAMGNVNFP
jgi:hypothetical protein